MRRLLRFNLRVLLIAVTVFAAWLGLHVHRTRVQEEAVQRIRAHHGWVAYDYQLPDGEFDADAVSSVPAWLRQKLGDDFFHSVAEVSFFSRWDEDGAVSVSQNPEVLPLQSLLAGVPKTEYLRLWGTQVNDKNLEAVADLDNLKGLVIVDGVNVSDAGTAHFKNLAQLDWLVLTGSQITDESIAVFAKLPRIRVLNLAASEITNVGVSRLSASNKLQNLFLHGTDDLPNKIDDDGIMALNALPRLRFLGVKNTQVTPGGVARFASSCPSCKIQR